MRAMELLPFLRLRELVWLEDHDGSFHLRVKRKMKNQESYPGLAGWAKRVEFNIHPVYLRSNGQAWDQPDGKESYVYFWHPYVRGKDPVEYRKQREANKLVAQQQAALQNSFYGRGLSSLTSQAGQQAASPPSQVTYKFTYSASPQLFQYINPPKTVKKLDCDTSVVAPLIGWRRWSVDMFGSTLKSNNGTKWEPYTKLAAECKASPSMTDPAGIVVGCRGVHCTCGIYAYKEREAAMAGENAPTTETHIFGEVWLWGRVIECETGFRAQYGYPKSIVNTGGIAEQLSIAYGVKLIPQEAPCTTTP